MQKKKIALIILIPVASIFFLSGAIYYFIFTTKGSASIVRFAISNYAAPKEITIKEKSGSLSNVLSLQDVELHSLKNLPIGSILKIQRIEISLETLALDGLNINIENGILKLPDSSRVLVSGTLRKNDLDFNIYSHSMDIRETINLFTSNQILKKISGAILNLDVDIGGSLSRPELKGICHIKEMHYDYFSLLHCPLVFAISLENIEHAPEIFGEIAIETGAIQAKNTAIKFKPSKILFSGDPLKPSFNLEGESIIDKTIISIALNGHLTNPALKLTSKPPIPQDMLLIMLATGKSWTGSKSALMQGKISPELAGEFIDFFLFGGSGNKLSAKLGISEISLMLEPRSKGLRLKKELTESLEAIYGIEQTTVNNNSHTISQRIGGAYKITDSISVKAEKEIKQRQKSTDPDNKEPQADNKVLLQFKREF